MAVTAAVLGIVLGCAAPPSGPATAPATVFAASTPQAPEPAAVWRQLERLLPADALLMGEQHDSPDHQRLQRSVVQVLAERGILAAVALEMTEQGGTTTGLPSDASEQQVREALKWRDASWPWAAYGPVVMAAVRAGQPAVLGELLAGVVLGNVDLLGLTGLDVIQQDPFVDMLARLGVLLLLFQVGLESTVGQMLAVGLSSLLVAVVGVAAPMLLGIAVSALLQPDKSIYVHLFVGATLTATSVGITARVLKDLGHQNTPEARIILGAAVIDDVLGLIILAVVGGVIAAAGAGQPMAALDVLWVIAKASGFLLGALVMAYRLAQTFGGGVPDVDPLSIQTVWTDANVRNELAQAQVGQAYQGLGVPDDTIWQYVLGFTPSEIAGWKADKRREEAVKIASVSESLRRAQLQAQRPTEPTHPAEPGSRTLRSGRGSSRRPTGAPVRRCAIRRRCARASAHPGWPGAPTVRPAPVRWRR